MSSSSATGVTPVGLSSAGEGLLRPALEAAVAVARAGDEATPMEPPPPALRPFLHFAKLPRPALVAARRVLDADDEFRSRVLDAVTESDVGRSGWIYLARPDGWEEELAAMLADAEDAGAVEAGRRAEGDARKRLAGAEAARRRAEDAVAAAEAESARATAALADERKARRSAVDDVARLERRLTQVSVERDRAKETAKKMAAEAEEGARLVAELRFALDQVKLVDPPAEPMLLSHIGRASAAEEGGPPPVSAAPPAPPATAPAPGPAAPAAPAFDAAGAAAALDQAAQAAAALAAALAGVAASLKPAAMESPAGLGGPGGPGGSGSGARGAAADAAVPARGPRAVRRVRPPAPQPVPLPPGIFDDSVEAADHLVRVPGVVLLVDGYNVSLQGWPELSIADQRQRLVDALAELSARSGAEVTVVFDGADTAYPGIVPGIARPVRVVFSPPGVEADDVVLARVAELRPFRPVVVASSDRRVQSGSSQSGANVISSAQLPAALHR